MGGGGFGEGVGCWGAGGMRILRPSERKRVESGIHCSICVCGGASPREHWVTDA
jgi:hypothetical protein